MFVGHAPDYIASLLTPASDIRSRCRCVHRVTDLVVPRTSRKIGDRAFPHHALGIGCRPTWNSCVRLLRSRTNWRAFCFMLLTLRTLRHWSDCRGRTYKSLLSLLLLQWKISCRLTFAVQTHKTYACEWHNFLDLSPTFLYLKAKGPKRPLTMQYTYKIILTMHTKYNQLQGSYNKWSNVK